jgi:hypothetical protein
LRGNAVVKTVTKRKKVILSIIGIFIILNLIPFLIPIHFPYDPATGCSFMVKGWHVELEKCKEQKETVKVPGYILGRPVTTVGTLCFYDNDKLISISFPKQTKKIDDCAFAECVNLESVEAENVVSIGEEAFCSDEVLKTIAFGNKLRTIKRSAFYECGNITSIELNDQLESIGSYAFGRTGIAQLPDIGQNVRIGSEIFYYSKWEKEQKDDFIVINNSLQVYKGQEQTVVIPDGITAIEGAFDASVDNNEYPIKLKTVYIPTSVTSIDRCSFYDQEDVTVYIPASVTEIGIQTVKSENGSEYDSIFEDPSSATIVTTAGSAAEKFAKEHNITCKIVDSWTVPDASY